MLGSEMSTELERMRKPSFRKYSGIFLEGLRKIKKIATRSGLRLES
jgi:hypothetical protein